MKEIKLYKNGSILELLKELLPDNDIIDLLGSIGVDELMLGGIKNAKTMSVQILIEGDHINEEPETKDTDLKEITIGDKEYKVEVVTSEEDMEKGLGGRDSLEGGHGMLFDFKEVQDHVTFNMVECSFPLDIIFINDDDEVISIAKGCPNSEDLYTESNVRYVLEVNAQSGVQKGDELDLDPNDETPIMKVLAPDGSTLMELVGGERIFSRKNTRAMIKWAKRCNKTKKESDYKHLGNLMFKFIKTLDSNEPEYVEVPEK